MDGFKKYQNNSEKNNNFKKNNGKTEYRKYRVRSTIKSFRDLEVYQKTNQLSVEIFKLEIPSNLKAHQKISEEMKILADLSKLVPKLIAESYGDKFNDFNLALNKLEKCLQVITNIIAKLDFLVALIDKVEYREQLNISIKQYQVQRRKILNLKNAWVRIFKK
jgi:hypothetical protein